MEKTENKKSVNYILKSLLAGGIAGSAAKTCVAPFDRVKILFQTSHSSYLSFHGSFSGYFSALSQVYSTQGIPGLFKGHSATILRIFPYAGLKFMFYEQLRTIFKDNKFVAGSIAGCGSVIVTYPFDVIRVRLAFETSTGLESSGIRGICKRIYHEPGPWKGQEKGRIWNFYRGLWPSLLGMIPYAGVSFYSYEKGKEVMSQWEWCRKEPRDGMVAVQLDKNENGTHSLNHSSNHKVKINDGALLVAGGISGMMAQTVSYPFEVIRRHMQVSSVIPNLPSKTITSTSTTSTTGAQVLGKSGSSEAAKGMIKTARDIVKARGLNGLFVGLGIGYLKIIPMFAVSFYTYEQAKLMLHI